MTDEQKDTPATDGPRLKDLGDGRIVVHLNQRRQPNENPFTNKLHRCDEPIPGEREWWAPARRMREQLLHGANLTDFDDWWERDLRFDALRRQHYDAVAAKIAAGHAADADCECAVCTTEANRWFEVLHCFDPYLNGDLDRI